MLVYDETVYFFVLEFRDNILCVWAVGREGVLDGTGGVTKPGRTGNAPSASRACWATRNLSSSSFATCLDISSSKLVESKERAMSERSTAEQCGQA